jgi:hypothetical protein
MACPDAAVAAPEDEGAGDHVAQQEEGSHGVDVSGVLFRYFANWKQVHSQLAIKTPSSKFHLTDLVPNTRIRLES